MMLIMSVAISCCRVICSERRMPGAASSDTHSNWQWRETKRQRASHTEADLHYGFLLLLSSPPPFHLSVSLLTHRLLTLIAASFLYDWEIYNPISAAPRLWLGPLPYTQVHKKSHTHSQKKKKNTHRTSMHRERVQTLVKLTHECFFSSVYMSSHVKVLRMRESACRRSRRCFGATYLQFRGLFNSCERSWTGCCLCLIYSCFLP